MGRSLDKRTKKMNLEEICRGGGDRAGIKLKLLVRKTREETGFKSPMGMCVTDEHIIVGDTKNNDVKVNFKLT